ncbi:hypothetical protein Hanom_Chr10g00917441 [Helianthus anomalus]
MSLHWKMDCEDKPVYMEDEKIFSLYVVAYKRDKGKMTTVPKGVSEKLYYLRKVKNFVLPRDEDLPAQPPTGAGELTNLGVGPEKQKKRAPVVTIAPKKTDAPKAQFSKAKNIREEKKGTRRFSESWCDCIVVSDTLEGLALVALRKPKAEPRDTVDIPASNPDDPIDLESSPEPLLRTKAVKRKQVEAQVAGKTDSFCLRGDTKATEIEVKKFVEVENPDEVEKPVEVELEAEKVMETKAMDVDVTQPKSPKVVARGPEKGKSANEDPVITIPTSSTTYAPVIVERSPVGDQGFFAHDEEDSPSRPEETPGDYYYRYYSQKKAYEIHAPVCRDWLQGTFPTGEVKFQEERSHDKSYHAYLKEATSFTSTTHCILREWLIEWAAFEASKKKTSEDDA